MLLLVAYGLGFVWFLRQTAEAPDLPARVDAIVVLTGGPERIESGMRLLLAGHAAQLLISGLGGGATLPDLARRAGVDVGLLGARVTLGRKATTTRTNASETAQFVRAHAVQALIVVTAGYHMPRALLELGRALPGIALHPAPVLPGRGMARTPTWRLLLEEYSKWLIVVMGLSGYAQDPGGAPAIGPESVPAPGRGGARMWVDGAAA